MSALDLARATPTAGNIRAGMRLFRLWGGDVPTDFMRVLHMDGPLVFCVPDGDRLDPHSDAGLADWYDTSAPGWDWLYDLADPATIGALLGLVREAHRCPWLAVVPLMTDAGVHGWLVPGMAEATRSPTEAAALVAALRGAPR